MCQLATQFHAEVTRPLCTPFSAGTTKAYTMLTRRFVRPRRHPSFCAERQAKSRLGFACSLSCEHVHGRFSSDRPMCVCHCLRRQALGVLSPSMAARLSSSRFANAETRRCFVTHVPVLCSAVLLSAVPCQKRVDCWDGLILIGCGVAKRRAMFCEFLIVVAPQCSSGWAFLKMGPASTRQPNAAASFATRTASCLSQTQFCEVCGGCDWRSISSLFSSVTSRASMTSCVTQLSICYDCR